MSYVENDKVKKLATDLASHETQKPGEWSGGAYGKATEEALQKVLNRDKFKFDINGDALYQQYKDRYIQQGKQAMMDTMGQAAALTGGYGNSYAQSVGQQTYQGYLQGLNDKVPELYQLALERYNQEGTDLLNKYGLLSEEYAKEYGRYRDSVGDWQTQRDYLANLYNNERNFDYTGYRDRVSDEQWQKNFDEALRQFNENMAEQKRQYDATMAENQRQFNAQMAQKNNGDGGDKTINAPRAKAVSADYNFGELMEAVASGMSKEQIEERLKKRGVDVNDSLVQADIKKAFSK